MSNLQFEKLYLILHNRSELRLRVVSASMSPLIKIGDEVIVKKVNISQLKRWDIIVFKKNKEIFVHCFWGYGRLNTDSIITRALADLSHVDQGITRDDILGIVVNFSVPLYIKILMIIKFILKITK